MTNNDYYFYINWEDAQKNEYRVGVLARLGETYYIRLFPKRPENQRDAFSHGYIGIPGFKPGQTYTSTNKLFDFFANRIYQSSMASSFDFMEELRKTSGRIMTDSFFVEEIPEKRREECKNYLVLMNEQDKQKNLSFREQAEE